MESTQPEGEVTASARGPLPGLLRLHHLRLHHLDRQRPAGRGAILEYADELTLGRALEGRRAVDSG